MFEIRYARAEDIEAIEALERDTAYNPWSAAMFEAELRNKFAHLLCAVKNDKIIGLCDIHIVYEDAHINNICVAKEFRREGVATALAKKACGLAKSNGCRAVTLEVRVNNEPARSFYDRLDFKEISTKKAFYVNPPDDAIVLQKMLNNS